jgi:hypothetical protein
MQMRFCRAAGIANMTYDLAGANLISDLWLHGARAHVRIKHITKRRYLDNDMIPGRIVEIDRDHILAGMRDVFSHSVRHVNDLAACNAVDWLARAF